MTAKGVRRFNRAADDVGNILALEHVNVTVPDQSLAMLFYINGLGFTREPYIDFGPFNVWINVGRQQFHLPTAAPQVLRGHVGVIVPNLDALETRLNSLKRRLVDTQFRFRVNKQSIDVICPWGNRIRCLSPEPKVPMQLGIKYVEFDVPVGTAAGIRRFYEDVMGCQAKTKGRNPVCEVSIGTDQSLRFKETRQFESFYDGHHIAIYVANFSTPHKKLKQAGLVTEESDAHQYRFQSIVDPQTGRTLFDIEHEVRSLHHPMYNRTLINRNAEQNFFNYQRDRDSFTPTS